MNALTRLERLDDLFPEMFRRLSAWPAPTNLEPLGEIRVDIDENEKDYAVRAEIPGAKKEDIHVEVDGNRVAISAEVKKDFEKKDDKAEKQGRVLVRETYRGRASRSFTLACEIDEAKVVARLEDGVLKLTLPKREGARSRRISIE
jgi:HSP20 family protein